MLAAESAVKGLDLPVATQGDSFQQSVGVAAQAILSEHKTLEKALQGRQDLEAKTMAYLQDHVSADHGGHNLLGNSIRTAGY